MLELLTDPAAWASFVTLSLLAIVFGVAFATAIEILALLARKRQIEATDNAG
jgi:hypothetical protein